ncbi:DDB1- and CUL4-associated factor 4-like isoform X1 [Acipenser ruthenus]|uniref:DDB1- and CUL4-associated factor 4-like isoform X1 n=1 Tax=Acipenser ruthenus TaxID=7906 RepID=UPI002741275D|nr:DDB1- and CUL4-associated factor 4-like isoform X1 [Acipenser ruthenus]
MKRGNWQGRGDWGRADQRQHHNPDRQRERSSHRSEEYRFERGGPGTSQNEPSPETASPSLSQSSPAPELPGFYFDPEKNRYFRLLPGHNNCNPLTREGTQQREQEGRRVRLLEEDEKPRKKSSRAGLNSTILFQKRHLGLVPETSYCRLIHELKVSSMRRHKLEVQSSDSSSPNTDNFKLIVADSACERVFTVNDVEHGGCKYGIMNFKGCSEGSLSVEMCDNLYFTNRKVNSICWASVTHPDSHVLLCLVGIADTPGCVSLLPASLFSNSNPDQPGMLCSFKISTAWSCAWCLNPQADKKFSTGLSRLVIVTDAVTGRRQTYGINSDVLAQQFALRAPVLYNGCRTGEIFSIDLRQRARRGHGWKGVRFYQDSAITSVRILQDDNYLIAADMLGKIKLWDLRMAKAVQQYEGHHNEHAYLPVHVNEQEGLLLAVGQDCYTRLWSLGDGRLLRTIPSPHPAGKDSVPSVVFSSQLGGRRGLPGLLMAVSQDLYYFSYNSDYQEQQGADA